MKKTQMNPEIEDTEIVDAKAPEAKADPSVMAEVAETAVAPAPVQALGTYTLEAAPLNFEWVHMTYAVSKNAPRDALPGEYYLGRNWEAKLTERGGSFDAVILRAQTGYKDWPTGPYDPSFRAQYYASKADAVAAGRRVDWTDGKDGVRIKPDAAPYLQLFMLVRRPETAEDDSLFTIALDGELYAPATLMFEKMNYTDAFSIVSRDLQADRIRHLREPGYQPTLLNKVYRIGSEEQTAKTGNRYTKFTLKTAVDNGKPVVLSPTAKEDLSYLIAMASTTTVSADADVAAD